MLTISKVWADHKSGCLRTEKRSLEERVKNVEASVLDESLV